MDIKKKYMPKGNTRPVTTLTRKQIIGFMARMGGGEGGVGVPQDFNQMKQTIQQQMPGIQAPNVPASPGMDQPQTSDGLQGIQQKLMSIFGKSPV